jgi:hypothetical protein
MKLFENFEVVEPILYGEPLNNREINFLKQHNIMFPELILKDDNYYYIFNHRCENIKDLPLTYIHGYFNKYRIENYTINDDLSVDVIGDVDLSNKSLTKIPFKFNIVSVNFYFANNQLKTLEGSPKEVGGNFLCGYNKLTTLEGSPKKVGGKFACSSNNLTTLVGAPKSVGGIFDCHNNNLTTLEGSPKYIPNHFYCNNNQLTSLKGSPESVGMNFNCSHNQLTTLEGGPKLVRGSVYCHGNSLTSVEYTGVVKGNIIYN